MADMIALSHGRPPWAPTEDSVVLAQYRYYDMPLVGVLRQHEREFFFACLEGEDEALSLWWYAAIDSSLREKIERSDPDEALSLIMNTDHDGWSRLAFATPALGIVDYEDVEDLPDNEGLRRAVAALTRRLDRLSDEAHDLQYSH